MQLAGYNFQNGQRSPDSTNKGTSWKRKKKEIRIESTTNPKAAGHPGVTGQIPRRKRQAIETSLHHI
jgi:hypothetical protein